MIPPNRTAKMLSRISAEVDYFIDNRPHPLDNVFSCKDLASFDSMQDFMNISDTYANCRSYDDDYLNYANGYPSDAEDIDDCCYDSETGYETP